jgi:hypothetical protein
MKQIRTLIHVHTDHSYDSDISVRELARFLARERFDCVAVTDHDTIDGALRLAAMGDARVIIGEEVTTRDGHLIGLFLEEWVRPGMSALDTANAIHAQGGLVLLPHPFVTMFSCGLGHAAWEIADRVDAVEVFNAQNIWPGADRKAREFAAALGLCTYVGADSHSARSIAPAYQVMPDFDTPAEFMASLRAARTCCARHPMSFFLGAAYRTARPLLGLPLPSGFGARHRPAPRRKAETLPRALPQAS